MTLVHLAWRDEDRTATIAVESDETVLEAAERAGLGLPFGCRTGACGTCTARLRSGAVTHRRPPRALKQHHLAEGYVLPCIAVLDEEAELEVGASIQAALVSNPWK